MRKTRKTLTAANAQLQAQLAAARRDEVKCDALRGLQYIDRTQIETLKVEKDKLETRLLWVATHIETVATWDIYPDFPAFCLAVDKEIDGI